MRPRSWLESERIHSGNFQQALFQQPHDFQAALRKFLRLIRMLGSDAIKPGHEFIDAWVVLHRAGAQRIHAQVNGVVPRRKPSEVAENFDLTHFGEPFDAAVAMIRAESLGGIGGGYVEWRQFERALSRRRLLENQPFALVG